MENLH